MDFFGGRDPSLFGLTRLLFGLLMVLDCFVERGLQHADSKWNDDGCKFPLFNFLEQLDPNVMILLQFIQGIGALCICVGYKVNKTGWLFVLPYWYIFFLDKTHWNNHSYLFGLIGIILTLTDSDKSFAISATNEEIPAWNYHIIRLQIFILYFYAGIKKTEVDWLTGYSMSNLSKKWLFDPFRWVGFSNDVIQLVFVNWAGFFIDISVGPMLLFDKTRPIAIFQLTAFHLMNSQMFSIGMFPYACLATMWIFCAYDSPKKLFSRLPSFTKSVFSFEQPKKKIFGINFGFVFFIIYAAIQLFLPYSHFITLGYNGWTQGAYGYSWDMMIHSFKQQHIKVTFVDSETGEVGYLQPDAYMGRARNRWSMHPDMLKQYADCLSQRMIKSGTKDPQIYFDVWKSMNERFVQRVYDPRIDIAHYDWKPFEKPAYTMPLLSHLNGWREKLKELKQEIEDENIDVTFVADYPGLTLENFLAVDMDNTTIELLGGEAFVTLGDAVGDHEGDKIDLKLGEAYKLPPGQFHTVHAAGEEPVMYMYIYQNSTEIEYKQKLMALNEIDDLLANDKELPANLTDLWTSEEEIKLREYFFGSKSVEDQRVSRNEKVREFKKTFYASTLYWLDRKVASLRRGSLVVGFAISDLIYGFEVNDENLEEYYERQFILDKWESYFRKLIKTNIDQISGKITQSAKTEL